MYKRSKVSLEARLPTKPGHYTVLTVYLVTNCSEMLLEIHFSVNGHTKQFHGILDWKRECEISCSQDHRLMFLRIHNRAVIFVPRVGSI